eukprot:SAG31_NODE_1291_length_8975_cov_26.197274_5_plen_172_part_00
MKPWLVWFFTQFLHAVCSEDGDQTSQCSSWGYMKEGCFLQGANWRDNMLGVCEYESNDLDKRSATEMLAKAQRMRTHTAVDVCTAGGVPTCDDGREASLLAGSKASGLVVEASLRRGKYTALAAWMEVDSALVIMLAVFAVMHVAWYRQRTGPIAHPNHESVNYESVSDVF